ncbi:MAG: TIR domain-containing protein [Cyanobacteria bacterium P01_F01_bin.86]
MTQVFLAHAETDHETMDQVRRSLWREGFTVWTSSTDIATGADFKDSINRGIEAADNLVYLLSPASLHSTYCQQELAYALSLNKRVIPIKVQSVDGEELSAALKELQYIDLTDNVSRQDYDLDESQLYKILRQDASYFEDHKILLTKALKWERQHRNPSLLLRGFNLSHGESWFKTAKLRSQYRPTPLQQEFIAESLRQPPVASLDVFISYSRADSDFARRLNNSLQLQEKLTWFDQESIPPGVDFQTAIHQGIEASDQFLFIISPSSIRSPYCKDEVDYAHALNKRILTVLHRPVEVENLHPVLAAVQWIDFNRHDSNFAKNFQDLIRTLDTDPEHLRTHTRLLMRAIEWNNRERKESLLLRGDDLEAAETWLGQSITKSPHPSELQVDYIRASRISEDAYQKEVIRTLKEAQAEAQRRIRRGTLYGIGMMLVGLISGLLAYHAVSVYVENRQFGFQSDASLNPFAAFGKNLGRASSAVSEPLIGFVNTPSDSLVEEPETEIELAEPPIEPPIPSEEPPAISVASPVRTSVSAATPAAPPQPRPESPASPDAPPTPTVEPPATPVEPPATPVESPDPPSNQVPNIPGAGVPISYLYDYSGQLVTLMVGTSPKFSPDRSHIVTVHGDRSYLYSRSGERLAELAGHSPRFNGNGQQVVTTSRETNTSYLYTLESDVTTPLPGHSPTFTADGASLVVKTNEGNSIHYSPDGEELGQFAGNYVRLSSDLDQPRILTTTAEGITHLYDLETGEQLATIAGRNPQFSPDQQQVLATAPNGHDSIVYDLDTHQVIAEVDGRFPTMSPDGTLIITRAYGYDRTYLYNLGGDRITELEGRYRGVSPDGSVITASAEGNSYLYRPDEASLIQFRGRNPQVSADGAWLVTTVVEANKSYLYATTGGDPVQELAGTFPSFSADDGSKVITRSRGQDRTHVHHIHQDDPSIEANGTYRGSQPSGFLTTSTAGRDLPAIARQVTSTKQQPAKSSPVPQARRIAYQPTTLQAHQSLPVSPPHAVPAPKASAKQPAKQPMDARRIASGSSSPLKSSDETETQP